MKTAIEIRGGKPALPALPGGARGLVESIGLTPLLPLPSATSGVEILGKAEWLNPGGSVKDRTAWSIVRSGLWAGRLPDRTLLDASSGNTAIAYAMLGAAIGFEVALCVPENASPERLRILRAYGAALHLTAALEGTDGSILEARRLVEEAPERYWYADQYSNAANWRAHFETTGLEIWRQSGGRITHFVAGLGTTGTLVGAGRRLVELTEGIRIIGVEPLEALHGIEGLKNLDSALRPPIYDPSTVHERLRISTEEAQRRARELALDAGLFLGTSSGAAYAACLQVASRLERGTIVTILPDGGERYLSEQWTA
jgi:cysteine synthase B